MRPGRDTSIQEKKTGQDTNLEGNVTRAKKKKSWLKRDGHSRKLLEYG
jgi:hypothetical protein